MPDIRDEYDEDDVWVELSVVAEGEKIKLIVNGEEISNSVSHTPWTVNFRLRRGDLTQTLMHPPGSYPGGVPGDLISALLRYQHDHIAPGGFLRAVLENNLMESVGRASKASRDALCSIVQWCYNELPSESWGSPERVDNWLKQGWQAAQAPEQGSGSC